MDAVPVVHGSALCVRGGAEALATATVGARDDSQRAETLLAGEREQRLYAHAAAPPVGAPLEEVREGGQGMKGGAGAQGTQLGTQEMPGGQGMWANSKAKKPRPK